MRTPSLPSRFIVAALVAALPAAAFAHTGADAGVHHGFVSGLVHPFTGIDHLAAMLAVGLWSALGARTLRWRDLAAGPIAFATLLFAGALLAAGGVALPAVEPMIAVSLLVLGLLVASQRGLPGAFGPALVGGFALFHGAAHGSELAGAAALAGMLITTALLHAAGLAIGLTLRGRSAWWARATGIATTVFGAALLFA